MSAGVKVWVSMQDRYSSCRISGYGGRAKIPSSLYDERDLSAVSRAKVPSC